MRKTLAVNWRTPGLSSTTVMTNCFSVCFSGIARDPFFCLLWLTQAVCQLARSMNSNRCGAPVPRVRQAVGSYPALADGISIKRACFPQHSSECLLLSTHVRRHVIPTRYSAPQGSGSLGTVLLRKPRPKQAQSFMVFAKCPIYPVSATPCRRENGSK